jgi:predicted Rossmann fold nucleotide-binding protein DprA/Smf involved in DNA uptake
LQEQVRERQAEIKQIDRALAAFGPKPEPKKKKKQWSVGPENVEKVYDWIAQSNGDPLSVSRLVKMTELSQPTVSKAISKLHHDGRIRLVRKDGSTFLWGPVT